MKEALHVQMTPSEECCCSYRGPILGFPASDHLFLAFLCSLQIDWKASSVMYNFSLDNFRPVWRSQHEADAVALEATVQISTSRDFIDG